MELIIDFAELLFYITATVLLTAILVDVWKAMRKK